LRKNGKSNRVRCSFGIMRVDSDLRTLALASSFL
jgi:hypothetical protein